MEKAKDPWRCVTCRRLNKSSAGFCGQCGYPWEQCWDKSYTHNASKNYAADFSTSSSWQRWDTDWANGWTPQRPKSPRKRTSQSPRSTRKGDGKFSKSGKTTAQSQQRWPAPVLDYSKIKDPKQDNKKPETVPPRVTSLRSPETSPEVQELLASLQANYPDGLPADVQAKVDRLKKTTTMDLKKHIGQLTKVKKDLTGMREARAKHMEAWKCHVTSLVESTKLQLQQYQEVLANFEQCENELVMAFDTSRKAILEITQQTTPAEEDVKAIKAVDSGLLAGGADQPIEVDLEEEDAKAGFATQETNVAVMNQLQTSLVECINSVAEGKISRKQELEERARPRSRSRSKEKDVKDL